MACGLLAAQCSAHMQFVCHKTQQIPKTSSLFFMEIFCASQRIIGLAHLTGLIEFQSILIVCIQVEIVSCDAFPIAIRFQQYQHPANTMSQPYRFVIHMCVENLHKQKLYAQKENKNENEWKRKRHENRQQMV